MAHFAQLDEANIVTQVIVVNNDVIENQSFPQSEQSGIEFCKSLFGNETNWAQTSYNASFRYNYAGVGYTYDANKDAFISPKPFDSWLLDESDCNWKSPIPYPNDGKEYIWNESDLIWVEYQRTIG